jgi:flagellar assembly protein FliH
MDGSTYPFAEDLAAGDDLAFVDDMPPRASGILYVEDFDAPPVDEPAIAEPAPPPDPFTEADIDRARAAGYAEGLRDALADASLLQAQLQQAATQALADALAASRATLDRVASDHAGAAAKLLLALAQAAVPTLMARHAAAEADAMIAALLPGLRCEAELRVRAHPDLADHVRERLMALWPGDGGVLSVAADPALSPGDVQVSWQDGHAARDCAQLWHAVAQILAPLGLPSLQEICRGDRN